MNTPVTRERSRAEAELHLDGDADDSDEDSYNRQQKEAVIDRKDDDYGEVEKLMKFAGLLELSYAVPDGWLAKSHSGWRIKAGGQKAWICPPLTNNLIRQHTLLNSADVGYEYSHVA